MPSMRQVRARIRVAKNIQQITKAMKMVAAARLKRAQDRVQSARPYAEQMRTVMGSLANAAGTSVAHPLLEQRTSIKRIGIVAITADRGLCGSYATNILKKTAEVVRTCGPDGSTPALEDIRGIVIGRKGQAYFRRRGIPVAAEFAINMTGTTFGEATEISRKAQAMYMSGEVDVVYLVYTKFLSALTQKPTSVQLLPLSTDSDDAAAGTSEEALFEPNAATLFGDMVPRSVDTLVYQALLESVASEHGSRMTAMSSATDNAGKMIANLTLVANRARQAAITKEISEIVGGADALRS
jgi:F-type H+-transporting ATPase subunit gamma